MGGEEGAPAVSRAANAEATLSALRRAAGFLVGEVPWGGELAGGAAGRAGELAAGACRVVGGSLGECVLGVGLGRTLQGPADVEEVDWWEEEVREAGEGLDEQTGVGSRAEWERGCLSKRLRAFLCWRLGLMRSGLLEGSRERGAGGLPRGPGGAGEAWGAGPEAGGLGSVAAGVFLAEGAGVPGVLVCSGATVGIESRDGM